MDNIEEMSTKISDLNKDNIQNLSENIQKELDNGVANNYMESNLEQLQQLQLKQLQELQKIQESQLNNQEDSEVEDSEESEVEKKTNKIKTNKRKSSSSSITSMLQEPIIMLCLFIFLSHDFTLNNLGKYIPNLISEEGTSMMNLIMRGVILVSIYFSLKMFILK